LSIHLGNLPIFEEVRISLALLMFFV